MGQRHSHTPLLASASVLTLAVTWACVAPSGRLPGLYGVISDVMGYAYMAAWSYSFYPQILLNWRRRSVEGLSLDFQMLNLLGFGCYAAYNVSLAYVPAVRHQYKVTFSSDHIPVGLEDVLFSLNALLATCFTLAQCVIYDRGEQRFFTPLGKVTMALGSLCVFGVATVSLAQADVLTGLAEWKRELSWVHLLLALSACKLGVSLIKYIPQVRLNARRSSTEGWSITNVLLDFTGGTLSVIQVVLQCIVGHDWSQIAGNPVKFGLGFVALSFDVIFMLQHYVWYRPVGVGLRGAAGAGDIEDRQQLVLNAAPGEDTSEWQDIVHKDTDEHIAP